MQNEQWVKSRMGQQPEPMGACVVVCMLGKCGHCEHVPHGINAIMPRVGPRCADLAKLICLDIEALTHERPSCPSIMFHPTCDWADGMHNAIEERVSML